MTETEAPKNIWFPGVYQPLEDDGYGVLVKNLTLTMLITLVQARATKDGEWCIETGVVGGKPDVMRRQMEFVSSAKHIEQCRAHIQREEMEGVRTVDWVCRELANASKYMIQ